MKTVNSTNTVYIYDNWAMIAELTTNSTQQTTNYYVWGLDLSQTLQGAGGVGGLLAVVEGDGETSFPTFDANGNIVDYMSTNGTTVAHYDYEPFGGTIASTGSKKDNFVFRFSTKYLDEEPNLYYYGYRFYSPELGRWLSRDPLGEDGFRTFHRDDLLDLYPVDESRQLSFSDEDVRQLPAPGLNLYAGLDNDFVNRIDLLGLVCGVSVKRARAVSTSGINAGHEWIVYPGGSMGFWPNRGWRLIRPDPAEAAGVPAHQTWGTKKKRFGKLKWGSGAGTTCKCATCPQIVDCLKNAPNPGWRRFSLRNNCRRFAKWSLKRCCLKKD